MEKERDPWIDAEQRYTPGQEISATVTSVTHFGVFAQVEPGLEGVIYSFELGSKVAHYAPGHELILYVKSIDAYRKRLELSPQAQSMAGLLTSSTLPADLQALHELPLPCPGLAC